MVLSHGRPHVNPSLALIKILEQCHATHLHLRLSAHDVNSFLSQHLVLLIEGINSSITSSRYPFNLLFIVV